MFTEQLITDQTSLACLDITDWNVCTSSTNVNLFYAYRRCLGDTRTLADADFYVFEAAEADQFRNVLHLALISLFDVAGLNTTTDFRFFASHDEYIETAWFEGAPGCRRLSAFSHHAEIVNKPIHAEATRQMGDQGQDISTHFTNRFIVVGPAVQRVNVDFTASMLKEVDREAETLKSAVRPSSGPIFGKPSTAAILPSRRVTP